MLRKQILELSEICDYRYLSVLTNTESNLITLNRNITTPR